MRIKSFVFADNWEACHTALCYEIPHLKHGLQTPGARPKIHSHSQIFRYGRSIFCLPHPPKFSEIFDLCLHWVSIVRDLKIWMISLWDFFEIFLWENSLRDFFRRFLQEISSMDFFKLFFGEIFWGTFSWDFFKGFLWGIFFRDLSSRDFFEILLNKWFTYRKAIFCQNQILEFYKCVDLNFVTDPLVFAS